MASYGPPPHPYHLAPYMVHLTSQKREENESSEGDLIFFVPHITPIKPTHLLDSSICFFMVQIVRRYSFLITPISYSYETLTQVIDRYNFALII